MHDMFIELARAFKTSDNNYVREIQGGLRFLIRPKAWMNLNDHVLTPWSQKSILEHSVQFARWLVHIADSLPTIFRSHYDAAVTVTWFNALTSILDRTMMPL